MSGAWATVLAVGFGTVLLKIAPALALGTHPLGPRLERLVGSLAPALLAALVVTQTFAAGKALVLDARAAGLAAAAIAIVLRLPVLAVAVAAALTAAVARTLL
jgi:uncharacterized membrane protein